MWTFDQAPHGNLGNAEIEPHEVLYEFDEPLIFRSKLGLADVLLCKAAEKNKLSIYLTCLTEDKAVNLLEEGRLSVRGAFDKDHYWLIATDRRMRVVSYWNCHRSDIPPRFFPKPGLGLYHYFGTVPDTVEQASALLAIKFKGARLTETGIPFGKFKSLVDRAFETSRKILTPQLLSKTRTSTFDFEIAQPRFSSLVIAIKDPVFNMNAIRRIKQLDKYGVGDLQTAVNRNKDNFAEDLEELKEWSEKGVIDPEYARENFGFLDVVADILPTEDGDVSSVEFNTRTPEGIRTVVIGREAAVAVRAAIKIAVAGEVVERGVITGINTKSNSLVIYSGRKKDVRCEFTKEQFDELLASRDFRVNKHIEVRGKLTRRQRVDLLVVETYRIRNDVAF